jgi:hypothetical protein
MLRITVKPKYPHQQELSQAHRIQSRRVHRGRIVDPSPSHLSGGRGSAGVAMIDTMGELGEEYDIGSQIHINMTCRMHL